MKRKEIQIRDPFVLPSQRKADIIYTGVRMLTFGGLEPDSTPISATIWRIGTGRTLYSGPEPIFIPIRIFGRLRFMHCTINSICSPRFAGATTGVLARQFCRHPVRWGHSCLTAAALSLRKPGVHWMGAYLWTQKGSHG